MAYFLYHLCRVELRTALKEGWAELSRFLKEIFMKFWTVSIAVLALSVAALAGGPGRTPVSMATLTSSRNMLMPQGVGANSWVGSRASTNVHSSNLPPANNSRPGGTNCVPEPVTMLALIPGVAFFIRRRKA